VNSEEAITLVEYNAWANNRVLLKAAQLTDEQLVASSFLRHQSTMATLIHILDAQWYWREGAQFGNFPIKNLSVADFASFTVLQQIWKSEDYQLLEYVRGLSSEKLNELVDFKLPQAHIRQIPLWQIIQHIISHGAHHRGELGQYLATLDKSPGDLDFIIYVSKVKH
jgi:uncharacterized damage-inducible protein DinB